MLLSFHACGNGPEDGIGGNAVDGHQITVPGMPSRSLGHRSLVPRAYLHDQYQFGLDPRPAWTLPANGDPRSLQVAMVTHDVVLALRSRSDRELARRVCQRFGFSKQLWSRCLLGESWMGETVLAAAVSELVTRSPRPPT
ncbi:hypothetical protein [Pedococcus soli]